MCSTRPAASGWSRCQGEQRGRLCYGTRIVAPNWEPAVAKPTVSLVIVDTGTYRLALQAVHHSTQQFAFDDVLIFSDNPSAWDGRPVQLIPKIEDLHGYTEFMIFKLPAFIRTDFFIVIQWDGFILQGDQFSPHFYHYDYIGAPWVWCSEFRVGNGGFSWRSRKLANAVLDLSTKQREVFLRERPDEDVWICRTNRTRLEENYSIRFGGPEIAGHFSLEHGTRPFPTFGFHGLFRLPYFYADNLDWLLGNLPARVLQADALFGQIAEGLQYVSRPHFEAWLRKRGIAPPPQ